MFFSQFLRWLRGELLKKGGDSPGLANPGSNFSGIVP
jgi:hypothetical protein